MTDLEKWLAEQKEIGRQIETGQWASYEDYAIGLIKIRTNYAKALRMLEVATKALWKAKICLPVLEHLKTDGEDSYCILRKALNQINQIAKEQ